MITSDSRPVSARCVIPAIQARARRFHQLSGHLFQGRYKAVLVDPEEKGYFTALSDYIHLNPVRAGMVALQDRLFDYRWSSYPWYAAMVGRPGWFEPAMVLAELGLEDSKQGRRAYAERTSRAVCRSSCRTCTGTAGEQRRCARQVDRVQP